MKICIIVDDYLPGSIKVAAKMMHELAVEFQTSGHEVFVITPGVGLKKSFETFSLNHINIIRFKSGEIKNVSKVKRLINELLLSFNAWSRLKFFFKSNHCDLIIYYSPSIFWGILVNKLRKLWNVPSYLILRDFFPQWVIDNGMIGERSLIAYFFKYFESKSYDAATHIGIMSPANLRWFQSKYKKYRNSEVLFNWASNTPVIRKDTYRTKLDLKDKVVFFYGGNIGHAQDMGNILCLAEKMIPYQICHFVLVGAGDEVELVAEFVKNKNLSNVSLLEPVSQDVFKDMLAEFDVGLFSLHKNHTTHNFPGKVLGYMIQGLPILGCVNPGNDMLEVIEEAKAGFVTISGDDEGLFQNALRLLDEKIRSETGKNAQNLLLRKFSVESAAKTILPVVHSGS